MTKRRRPGNSKVLRGITAEAHSNIIRKCPGKSGSQLKGRSQHE